MNEIFVQRVKLFIKPFFGYNGLNAEWHWYRFEWQKRGNIYVHGLARLQSDIKTKRKRSIRQRS